MFRSCDGFHSELVLLENQRPSHETIVLTILSFSQIQQWLTISLQNKRISIEKVLKFLYGPYDGQIFLSGRPFVKRWRPFVKRFTLCYRTVLCPVCPVCLSCLTVCLSVCDVGVLWPDGLTDQDEAWHAGRPRAWLHCVRWGPSSPPPNGGGATQFSAHICCSQMAGWIEMPLGMARGRPQTRELCVRWEPTPPKFSAHVYYSYCDFVRTLHKAQ